MSSRTLRFTAVSLIVLLCGSGAAFAAPQTTPAPARRSGVPAKPLESADVATLTKLAEQGDAAAQCSLGVLYLNGRGVPQDYPQALSWLRRAADQGNVPAMFDLGLVYDAGQGVPQDDVQAAAWYRKAADKGNADAMYNLGALYSVGQGVPQDYVEAHQWRSLAAARASAAHQKQYADSRDALAEVMTPAQLAEAQKRAREWLAAFNKRQK